MISATITSNTNNTNYNKLIQKSTDTKTNDSFTSIYDELKSTFSDVKLNYKSVPASINEDSIRQSGFGFGEEYGSIHNVDIDPKVAKRMEQDPKYRQQILSKVIKDLSTPIPQIPGVKVASAGTIVHSDGSITGYIVGEPTEEAKKAEAEMYVSKRKERKKEQAEHEEMLEALQKSVDSEKCKTALDSRAQLVKLSMNI